VFGFFHTGLVRMGGFCILSVVVLGDGGLLLRACLLEWVVGAVCSFQVSTPEGTLAYLNRFNFQPEKEKKRERGEIGKP
jgi:hypothetical protein